MYLLNGCKNGIKMTLNVPHYLCACKSQKTYGEVIIKSYNYVFIKFVMCLTTA